MLKRALFIDRGQKIRMLNKDMIVEGYLLMDGIVYISMTDEADKLLFFSVPNDVYLEVLDK